MKVKSNGGNRPRIVEWIDARLPVFTYLQREYGEFPMPRNVNYLWSLGAIASVFFAILMVTGIFLAMHYTAHKDLAFDSVERIMRDVNWGWLLRYMHMNGASFFFAAVYIHLLRGLYYGSYKAPRELLWIFGVVLLLCMMASAFLGYVLPWGQMSYWAATVITNLFSAIPLVGDMLVSWILGGYSVDNPTLTRFYALHYLMAFVIAAVIGLHVIALHIVRSNNPLGIEPKSADETVPFHPYLTAKDGFAIVVALIAFSLFTFFAPNMLGETVNYVPANPLQTPPHIVPEWYFWPFYAILRAVPNLWIIDAKLGGVIAMGASILVLFFVPWLDTSPVRSARFRPIYRGFFWVLIAAIVALGWAGSRPPEGAALWVAKAATLYYFAHFLVVLPLLGRREKTLPLPASISAAIKSGAA
ncbi:MAG: cytochrome b [Alphaproteobacteria bacterium]|nr:cytochrome b [Alphaproteobacteria bacterium]